MIGHVKSNRDAGKLLLGFFFGAPVAIVVAYLFIWFSNLGDYAGLFLIFLFWAAVIKIGTTILNN